MAPHQNSSEYSVTVISETDPDGSFEASETELRRATILADLAILLSQADRRELSDDIDNPLLIEPINLDIPPYENNIQSPTPLDPDNVLIDGIDYRTHAYGWMERRFYSVQDTLAASDVTIDDLYARVIIDEINAQHGIRCEQNQGAYGRLLTAIERDPSRFTDVHAKKIKEVRGGFASTLDRVRLLIDFPEMRGIEDMKDTAVFDERGYVKRRDTYARGLMRLNLLSDVTITPCSNAKDTPWLDVVDPRGILLIKRKIAEVTSKGVTLDVVERRSYCALPTRPQLRGIPEQLKRLPGSNEQRNLQLIGGSVYLRTRQSLLEGDDPEDMNVMLFVDKPSRM